MNHVLNINLSYGKMIDNYEDSFDNNRKTFMVISMKLKIGNNSTSLR